MASTNSGFIWLFHSVCDISSCAATLCQAFFFLSCVPKDVKFQGLSYGPLIFLGWLISRAFKHKILIKCSLSSMDFPSFAREEFSTKHVRKNFCQYVLCRELSAASFHTFLEIARASFDGKNIKILRKSEKLTKNWQIKILSSRCPSNVGRESMKFWIYRFQDVLFLSR